MWTQLGRFDLIEYGDGVHAGLDDGLWVVNGWVWIHAPADPGMEAQITAHCCLIEVKSKRVIDNIMVDIDLDYNPYDMKRVRNVGMVRDEIVKVVGGVVA